MKISITILALTLASLACQLETTIPQSAPSAAITPPLITGDTPEPPEPESGAVFEQSEIENRQPKIVCAIVTAIEALHLRAEPSEKSQVIDWLRAGQVVNVIHKEPDWWMVQAGPRTGYARADYLAESECL